MIAPVERGVGSVVKRDLEIGRLVEDALRAAIIEKARYVNSKNPEYIHFERQRHGSGWRLRFWIDTMLIKNSKEPSDRLLYSLAVYETVKALARGQSRSYHMYSDSGELSGGCHSIEEIVDSFVEGHLFFAANSMHDLAGGIYKALEKRVRLEFPMPGFSAPPELPEVIALGRFVKRERER